MTLQQVEEEPEEPEDAAEEAEQDEEEVDADAEDSETQKVRSQVCLLPIFMCSFVCGVPGNKLVHFCFHGTSFQCEVFQSSLGGGKKNLK